MPHQCIECGRTFPDGSKEMLSGCPDCGGNKFQFKPGGTTESKSSAAPSADPARSDDSTPSASSDDPAQTASSTGSASTAGSERPPDRRPEGEPPSSTGEPPSSTTDPDATDPVTADPDTADPDTTDPDATDPDTAESNLTEPNTTDPVEGDAERIDDGEPEDAAQANARSDVVSPDELDRAARETGASETGSEPREPPASQPGVEELRDELNEQFESIRIVSPGQYELNLMELYDRQEYIISLQEDGRYVIEMPDAWGVTDE